MKKLIILIIIMFALINIVTATDVCENKLLTGETCRMVTPLVKDCNTYTYNVTNTTPEGTSTAGALLSVTNGIYYFTFNITTPGGYITELCDGTTREITVVDENKYGNCKLIQKFDTSLIWLNIGMIMICMLFFYFNLFKQTQDLLENKGV